MESKRSQILIVDKNNGGSFVLGTILTRWNYEIFKVNSFLKAIEYVKNSQYSPDLIIVELEEPSPIFYDFPNKFKERTGKDIPIVVHSAFAEKSCVHQSLSSGYKDYLIRPMMPDLLKDKISNIVKPNLKLNDPALTFHLDEEASLLSKLILDYMNELEIEASSQFPIKPGTIVTVQSETLKEIGFTQTDLRVDNLKKRDPEDVNLDYPYKLKLSFTGLSADDYNKLKMLVESKSKPKVA